MFCKRLFPRPLSSFFASIFIYHIVYIHLRIPSPLLLSCVSLLLSTGIFLSTYRVILFIECITPIQSSFFGFSSSDALFLRFPLSPHLSSVVNHTANSHTLPSTLLLPIFAHDQRMFTFIISLLPNVDLCTQYYRQLQKASTHASLLPRFR